jgi:hypothetical protein
MIILCMVIGQLLGSFAAPVTNTISTYGSIVENTQGGQGGTNILSNGDFSNGFEGWQTYTDNGGQVTNPSNPPNSYVSLDYSIYHTAAPSCKILADPDEVTPGDPSIWRANSESVYPGETIIVQAWVYIVGPNDQPWGGARVSEDFRDSRGNDLTNEGVVPTYISSTFPPQNGNVYGYVPYGTSGWVLDSMELYVPANAVWVCLWLQTMPAYAVTGNTGYAYYDDAAIILVN